MNSVLIDNCEIKQDKTVVLSTTKSQHLIDIVKVKAGDQLKVTILEVGLNSATVTSVADGIVTIELNSNERSGKSYPISLIIGASRPQTMKKVIEHGSSLGVNDFQILNSELSEKSYLQSNIYEDDNFKKLTHLGLEQSAIFFNSPKCHKVFSAVRLNFGSIKQRFILSPYTSNSISESCINIEEPCIFAIGPERGWTKEELDYFISNGFLEVKISPSILRVEVATLSLLGLLNQQM